MELKNWAFSLFQPDKPLYQLGFVNVRPTPTILTNEGVLTPDLVAWSDSTILIMECCSGIPDQGHSIKADKYSQLPTIFFTTLTGISSPLIETILLFYEHMFDSNSERREGLLKAISIRHNVMVWTCIPRIAIRNAYGSHANEALNSMMRGGVPLGPYPSPPIEIQPDSPLELLARVLFRRLFEQALRNRDTSFTVKEAQASISDQNYSTTQANGEEVKLRRAIEVGVKFGLCTIEQSGVRWRIDIYIDRPLTLERFLARLTGIELQPRLTNYGLD